MLDVFNLPDSSHNSRDFAVFWPTQYTGATGGWQIWSKPPGKRVLEIVCIGGGGGGGGGAGRWTSGFPGVSAGGGGGGGSSGITRCLYPMAIIPDNLYVLVGHGGVGGAGSNGGTGGTGGAGQLSYVAVYPNTAANNLFAVSGAAGAGGGTGGSTSNGAGGAASTIATVAGMPFSNWGICQFIAGVAGSGSGSSVNIGTGCMILGGVGGGSIAGNGSQSHGTIPALANTPLTGNGNGALADGTHGNPGFQDDDYPVIYGGMGGRFASSINGGNGGSCGRNAFGAGGGGGGSGSSSVTGGRGGIGGPGVVTLKAW